MRLHRADPLINDAIEALDQRLLQARRQIPKDTPENQRQLAWSFFSPSELQFVRDELTRCTNDRRYYLQNYHVIQPEHGVLTCIHPFRDHQELVDATLARLLQTDGQARIITLKERQSGMTEYCNGVVTWRTIFLPNAYTISVAQDPSQSSFMQRKFVLAYNHLPFWMQPEQLYFTKGEYIELGRKDLARAADPGLGSIFVSTHAMRQTGTAIGRTVRTAHFSEVSRWPDGEVYTGDIEPSMNAADTIAFAESTAWGSEGFFYNLWTEAMAGESDWTPVFLSAYRDTRRRRPIKPSEEPFTLTETEEKFTEKVAREERYLIPREFWNWRRRGIKRSISRTGFPYAHYESYPITPSEAFQSSGMGAFPRHKLDEQLQRNVCRPEWIGEIIYQGRNIIPRILLNHMHNQQGNYLDVALEKREMTNRLYIWEQPDPSATYYVGVDVGDGILGGDLTVAEVFRAGYGLDPDTQVAEWVGYEPPIAFAKIVYALSWWYNQAEAAIEYAREGMSCANSFANELEYPKIYVPRRADRVGNQFTHLLHWMTTPKTKPYLMSRMAESLLEDSIVIRSQYLLDELRICVKDSSSFSGLGGHDDAAVAACFPAGTKVDTSRGPKSIEDLRKGDQVVSDDGRNHEILQHGSRPVNESVVRFKVFGIPDEIVCTNEHPILGRRRIGSCPVRIADQEWIPAADLKENDFVYVPTRKLPPTKFTEDELYLLGWYLSDGCASKTRGQVSFTLSPKDDETRLCSILRRLIDEHPTCYLNGPKRKGKHERRGAVKIRDFTTYKQVLAHNKWMNKFLRTYGGDPKAKFVHPDIVNSYGTLPLAATFLMGDGSQTSKRMDIKAVQKNKAVLRSIHRILLDHGIWSSLYPDRRGRFELAICGEWVGKFIDQVPWTPFKAPLRVMSHPITRAAQSGYWAQVQRCSVEHFVGSVYNMEVADTHTYLVNGVAVHNCIAHYCLRETMPELRRAATQQSSLPSPSPLVRSLHPSIGQRIYVLYDELFRMRGQSRDLQKMQLSLQQHPGWSIRPVVASKANTAYSLLHHGTGIESELFRAGMAERDITTPFVQNYAEATGRTQLALIYPGYGAATPGAPGAEAGESMWDSNFGELGGGELVEWGEMG